MRRLRYAFVVALAMLGGVAFGGTKLLATPAEVSTPACEAASSWRNAAADLHKTGASVEVSLDNDRGVIGIGAAYQSLVAVALPRADAASDASFVSTLHEANRAAERWVSDGFEFLALINSGMSSPAQRHIALEEYETSRLAWTEAAAAAGSQLSSRCAISAID